MLELIALWQSVRIHGAELFQFYTQDSNLFALLASALLAVVTARALKETGKPVPSWALLLKYMAACCLAVTFVVVLTVLAPMEEMGGYGVLLFSGSMLYHHLLCPVLALVSFIFLEPVRTGRRETCLAMLPTLFYAAVAIVLNLLQVLDGPYPFLRILQQSALLSIFWFALILGGAYALARGIELANRKCAGKE